MAAADLDPCVPLCLRCGVRHEPETRHRLMRRLMRRLLRRH